MGESIHIIHVNSASSSETYKNNAAHDFKIRLPELISLEPVGDWYCCVKQCSIGFHFPAPLYLCTDICHDSVAGEKKLPVLRVIHQRTLVVYNTCVYVPVKVRDVSELRIYLIRTRDYKPPGYNVSSQPPVTHLTLEFRRGFQRPP